MRRRVIGAGCPNFWLENRSGYDSVDLARAFCSAFRVLGIRTPKHVLVVPSPIRTRGCAEVSVDKHGARMVIAIAPPSRFTMRRFARILEHECAHLRGVNHKDMAEPLLYSEGSLPRWASRMKLRYRGRAPSTYATKKKTRRR